MWKSLWISGVFMQLSILCVGKLKESYLIEAISEYQKRLNGYTKLEIIEILEEKIPDVPNPGDIQQGMIKEGQRIITKIPKDSFVFSLAIQGEMKSSEQLAAYLNTLYLQSRSKLTFIIGGSHGLSNEVIERSDALLSFSKMTFPHQLMRVILLEQLYRAYKINRNEPYHK